MEKQEALNLLKRGERAVFNSYRERNQHWLPDFSYEDLSGIDFLGESPPAANLDRANLSGCRLNSDNSSWIDDGRTVSLKDAIIDTETNGLPLHVLQKLGARFATKAELEGVSIASRTQVFISYAWANSDVVTAIDKWLRLKGIDTRIDKRDFFAGSRIRDEIARLMAQSDVVLVFHSKESKNKPWIDFERELVGDLQMSARKEGRMQTRVIYIVIDGTPLPNVSEENRIAIMAKGKQFELVCEEIYHSILRVPQTEAVDLASWQDYVF